MRVTGFDLTCDSCQETSWYDVGDVWLAFFTTGVCTANFFCIVCQRPCSFPMIEELGREAARHGAAATDVEPPLEVLEWPSSITPKIQTYDVGLLERSTLEHFNERLSQEVFGR